MEDNYPIAREVQRCLKSTVYNIEQRKADDDEILDVKILNWEQICGTLSNRTVLGTLSAKHVLLENK